VSELNNCPVCDSTVSIDSSGAAEIHGYAWQDLAITCDNIRCWAGLTFSSDWFYLKEGINREEVLINTWNTLTGD